jgi:hypothetical protein
MPNDEGAVWLAAGLRTPFVAVDGPFAHRDSLALSVPVLQAMAPQVTGPIDFAIWGSVVHNLAYANLAREVWNWRFQLRLPAGLWRGSGSSRGGGRRSASSR